ncbi:hypothetical protein [Thermococcus sp.]
MKKILALLGMFFLVGAVMPGVYAEGDLGDGSHTAVQILDDVYYLNGLTWSDTYNDPISGYVDTTAGGTVQHVYFRTYWDGLVTADLIVLKHAKALTTNTGDRREFIKSIGSAFFGKGSYHTFSDVTGSGFEKYWVSADRMVGYGSSTGTVIQKELTMTVYAESEVEAEQKVSAGFEELGIGAEVSVSSKQKIGTKFEYTVKVIAPLYLHDYDTEFTGKLNMYYYTESSNNPMPLSFKQSPNLKENPLGSYVEYREKEFDFKKDFQFYSYQQVDMYSQGIEGELTS